MAAAREWVMLAYRLPREPSTPRIAVWKRLRRLGVAQPLDGLVLLPATAATREALEWVAERVVQADGQATLWAARHTSAADERALVETMTAAVASEYADLARQAAETLDAGRASGRPDRSVALSRAAARLARALAETSARDYFGSPGRVQAQDAVTRLAAAARGARHQQPEPSA